MNERELFIIALQIDDPAGRSAYLDKACGDDAELRQRVETLLQAFTQAGSFLDRPVATVEQPRPSEGPGTVIGPYKLLQQIGEGGMGTVFMAEQIRPVQRKVALKVIKPGMDSRQVVARFEAERQALAMMDHVNIARVLDAGATDSGRPYFVMELVHGVPITKYCDDNQLTPRERLELFVPVCQAIQHAHQKGIIHRDVKPTNVMVTLYDGKPVPKVIDFGVAKATEQRLTERTLFTQYGTMVGTLEYMSPEQAEMSALGVDTRSDVYSLGVLLYELLTGSTPLTRKRFKDAAYGEIVRIIKEEEPPKPSTRISTLGQAAATVSANRRTDPKKLGQIVRGELDWIVMKCLEKDRNRRYDTANSLAADVQRYLNDETVQACPPSASYRFRKFARRNRAALATAAAVALAMLGAVAVLATSTILIAGEQQATENALNAATQAKGKLQDTLESERQDSYFHRIALAHSELSVNNLRRALELLGECPEDLREWEWHYLKRLCWVEPVVLRDTTTEVNSIAFSPDGKFLASAGGDGKVKVWNSKTRKVVQTLENAHTGFVTSVAFHPDGKHLASVGADKQVKVWDWTTGDQVFHAPCDGVNVYGTAYAAAFNPLDGRQLAAGSNGDVNVWDWRNQLLPALHTLAGHEKHRISVAFSRDGRRLAAGNWRGSVKLWDAEAGGEPLLTFPNTTSQAVSALAFNKDGGRLATANFRSRVDVWDTATGRLVYTLPHSRLVLCVAFSPDGRLIASAGDDKAVHIWDATTGRELLGLHGHIGACGCVAFSPDGLRLASASMDGTIRVWDATPLQGNEGQEAPTFTNHSDEIKSVTVSPDGQRIASAGWDGELFTVMVWDAKTGQVSAKFTGQRSVVFCAAWRPDGQRIASAGWDGELFTVTVWDAQTGREVFPPWSGGPDEFFAVAFSPDGQYLVTGSANGTVQVWDARTGDKVGTLGAHDRAVRAVAFSRDGRRLASVSHDGVVKLWDATRLVDRQEARRTLRALAPGPYLNVAFSPDGERLVTGGKEVKIWDVQTGKELQTLRGHSGDVYTVAFSPDDDGRWVASAGEDSTVKVWDSHTGELRRTFRGHTGLVSSLAFTPPHGKLLVSGSRDHKVKIWDMTQLEEAPDR